MAKKKALGRGLGALLNSTGQSALAVNIIDDNNTEQSNSIFHDGDLKKIPIEFIQRGKYQPRRDIQTEALEELAESIKSQGVIQPIVVRPINSEKGSDRYEIIAGERRWRASQLAGLDIIPAVIREVPDEAAIAMALIENIQREDLNPIEEATALKRLKDEFDLTHQEVADAVGKSRTTITNLLRLMNLKDDVRRLLEYGDIEMGHARALLSLDPELQSSIASTIVGKALSVRQTESLVRNIQKKQLLNNEKDVEKVNTNADIKHLEDELSDKIGVPVIVQHSAKGKGRLILKYNSLDELDGILAHIQ